MRWTTSSRWPASSYVDRTSYADGSQVVARVRLVERLVAEREVRDDVLEQRVGQRAPVQKRRVHDLDAVEPARRVRHHPVHDAAPPPLDHPERRLIGWERAEGSRENPRGQSRHRLPDESHRLARLLEPDPGARLDVARLEYRHPHLELAVGGEGMVAADVDVDARAAGDEAEDAVVPGGAGGQPPGALETIHDQGVLEREAHDLVEVLARGLELPEQIQVSRQVVSDAPGDNRAAQQPVAGEALVQTQQALANAEAMRMRHGVAGVVDNHAEVAYVVVEPLHLQEDHAQPPRTGRDLGAGGGFQRLAESERVTDGGVAGDTLGQLDPGAGLPPLEELLGALV